MKTNEVRVGNWVYLVDEESEDSPFLRQVTVSNIGDPEFFEPIPLTPEILEKAKFDKNYFDVIKFKDGYSVSDNEGNSMLGKPIYYLHQLQNLYFALTGEELQIKPNLK